MVSSTAVIAQRVGTNFLFLPRSPAVISSEIRYTSISEFLRARQASAAPTSVSEMIRSTTRSTLALPMTSISFTDPVKPTGATVPSKLRRNATGFSNATSTSRGTEEIAISRISSSTAWSPLLPRIVRARIPTISPIPRARPIQSGGLSESLTMRGPPLTSGYPKLPMNNEGARPW